MESAHLLFYYEFELVPFMPTGADRQTMDTHGGLGVGEGGFDGTIPGIFLFLGQVYCL